MITIICTASFLSTLSLRRATISCAWSASKLGDFYPRSPCGERRQIKRTCRVKTSISIHALLAESDRHWQIGQKRLRQFLSTLSLRRATVGLSYFYIIKITISIHALLAESDVHYDNYNLHCVISIHALLAESDPPRRFHYRKRQSFLSTLSLRRATAPPAGRCIPHLISIHALLAESDSC